jgi:hypothetical protein
MVLGFFNSDLCKDGSSGSQAKGSLRQIKKTGLSRGSLPGFFDYALVFCAPSSSLGLRHNQI